MNEHPKPAEIGQTIQALRQRANMSQKDLATQANLSQAQVSQMERGNANPSLDTLNSVARALNVPTWILLAGLALLAVGAASVIVNQSTKNTKT